MFLVRLTLKRSPDVAALGQLLDPGHQGRRIEPLPISWTRR